MRTLVTGITRIEKETERIRVVADKLTRSHLAKLAEEMSIPWKELNKVAKEVVSREFGDCRNLTEMEVRRVMKYLKGNYEELSSRYRRMRWE